MGAIQLFLARARWLLLVLLAGGLFAAGWWLRDLQAERDGALQGKAAAEHRADQGAQALSQFAGEVGRLAGIADRVQGQTDRLAELSGQHITEYRSYVTNNPLPADCRIDPERLRRLQAGIAGANRAIAGDADSGEPADRRADQ